MYNYIHVVYLLLQPDNSAIDPPEVAGKAGEEEGGGGGGGGEEATVIGGGKGEGGNGDGTEVVELEFPTDEQPEEGEEEEDGMIKPIIRFDKFPPDLSWDQI